jgi:hypothetical protein
MNFGIILLVVVLGIYGANELLRFKKATKIAQLQYHEHWEVFHKSECVKDISIVSVKYGGHIYHCEALKSTINRSQLEHYEYYFMIWFYTGWWMHMYSVLIENTFIFVTLTAITIIAFIFFGFNACVQDRANTKLINQFQTIRKQQDFPQMIEHKEEYQPRKVYKVPKERKIVYKK